MFQKFKNIETAFQHVRGFTIIITIGCFLAIGYIEYQNKSLVKTIQSRLYVLYNGKVLEAIATDRQDNLAVEARDHIRTFHELFFTLAPDEKVIQTNLAKALYLADASAKDEYDNLRENGYFANMIAGNVSQELKIDSVAVDLRSYPYHFRCYGVQNIVRTSSTVSRSLITEGELRSISRSDNNPHGFLIQRWHTIENKDLKVDNH
ncbi:conjugative transposon protein TraK [Mucilaginibacter litoreus]|uniref:Conjugative transposon protein TraK n=1 Tax=Mucilaginibacter litoreus TaxID=1048221 RepID=A0ABW3AYM9_9SPHI